MHSGHPWTKICKNGQIFYTSSAHLTMPRKGGPAHPGPGSLAAVVKAGLTRFRAEIRSFTSIHLEKVAQTQLVHLQLHPLALVSHRRCELSCGCSMIRLAAESLQTSPSSGACPVPCRSYRITESYGYVSTRHCLDRAFCFSGQAAAGSRRHTWSVLTSASHHRQVFNEILRYRFNMLNIYCLICRTTWLATG